jgi:hypothetical protein
MILTELSSGTIHKEDFVSKVDLISRVRDGEILFIDIWGNWNLYKYSYSTFDQRINEYIEWRKFSISYFNRNYIDIIYKRQKRSIIINDPL